ncbi:MAG TPA: Gfo/Idh/MocA family oxidoreductase, partial [Chloroflexota bacterium]|nr:Gfo/Idh/MocA family oxidoreductase [Chloroflexota bacterium]
LVGAGEIGRAHLPTLLQLADTKVIGVADPIIAAAEALAARSGATAFADYRQLLGKIDAVWICTPTFLHPEQSILFAGAGVHVFCEKPIALDLPSADRMITAARSAGVQLMIGQVIRYFPETIAIKKLLIDGELGDPVYVYARRLFTRSTALTEGWRRDVKTSGGMTLESGVHEVDTVRWLGGEIVNVGGNVVYSDPANPDFDTDFRGVFRLKGGATGAVEVSTYAALRDWSWGIVGTKATALSPRRGEIQIARAGAIAGETALNIIPVDPVYDSARQVNRTMLAENQAFVDAIRDGQPVPIPGEEGRRNLEVILTVKKVAQEKVLLAV